MESSPPVQPPACPSCGRPLRADQAVCLSCGYVLAEVEYRTQAGSTADDLPEPRTIGEFQIRRILGHGSAGIVCEAYSPSLDRNVALKIMDTDLPLAGGEEARLDWEAWIGGHVDHPNVVKVHSRGADGSWRYVAMELIDGGSLQEFLRRAREGTGPSDPPGPAHPAIPDRAHVLRMARLFVQAADALEHVHQRGILHRDIKPGNLLLSGDGSQLLVTDFGLAVETGRRERNDAWTGTVRYMPPERLGGLPGACDQRSDIYALGVSLYEAVTWSFPFDGDTEDGYTEAVQGGRPVPARLRNPAVPAELERILSRCLEADPARRYPTALALAADLRSLEGAGGHTEGRP
jgi:eukaryotic-like serine/threonine-protein kinase